MNSNKDDEDTGATMRFHLAELDRLIREARRARDQKWAELTSPNIQRPTLTSTPGVTINTAEPAPQPWLTPDKAKMITGITTAIVLGILGALQASGAFDPATKRHDATVEEERKKRWEHHREQTRLPANNGAGGTPTEAQEPQ